ncbi:MAG: FlaD/FlaE family flagellar protein [Salinigranum sp.]
MRLDPDDYNPEELQRMAMRKRASDDSPQEPPDSFAFGDAVDGGAGSDSGEARRASQLEELVMHQSRGDGQLRKPYLDRLPDEYAAERIVFEWLEFLVLKAGFKRTRGALRQYRLVEWITPEVEAGLREYLVGFSADVENVRELDVEDHQRSLLYVARLASLS